MKERIKLHLFDYHRLEETYDAPIEVTQAGIAEATGIRVQHVGQYVKPLEEEGLVQERSSHIKGQPRRRKVYFLTTHGKQDVASLRSALWRETVPLRHLNGETEETPLSHIYQEVRRGTPLVRLLEEQKAQGYIAELSGKGPVAVEVDYSRDVPPVETFYGREMELAEIPRTLNEVPLVVVEGIAGAGKTTLAAKIRDDLRGKRALFWRSVEPWDSASDLLRSLAGFLRALGRHKLFRELQGTGAMDLRRTEELLRIDLTGLDTLLVFDNLQNASEDSLTLFQVLRRVLGRTHPHTWTLMLTRERPRIYSRRDVSVDHSVGEFSLEGLSPEASLDLLEGAGVPEDTASHLATLAGGHPLFLKILAASHPQEGPRAGLQDLEVYIAEEIVPRLDADAWRGMEVASFFEIPVPFRGILLEVAGGKETLFRLRGDGLLGFIDGEVVVVHDRIRAYFREGMAPKRREALLAKIVPWMLEEAERRRRDKDFESAIALLENAVAIENNPGRLRAALRHLGYARWFIGDLQGAAEAYHQAIPLASEAPERAWLHRTIAWASEHADEREGELFEAERLIPEGRSRERAWLLLGQAYHAMWGRGEPETAYTLLEEVSSWLPSFPQDRALTARLAHEKGFLAVTVPQLWDPALALEEFRLVVESFAGVTDSQSVGEGALGGEIALRAEDERIVREMTLPWSLLLMGWAAVNVGREEEGLAYIGKAAAMDEESGYFGGRLRAPLFKAETLMILGRLEEAEELFDRTLLKAQQFDPLYRLLNEYSDLSYLYYLDGRLQEARETLEYLLAASEAFAGEIWGSPRRRTANLALLVTLCTQLNDFDAAERFAREAETAANEDTTGKAAPFAAFARGTLHAARGDIDAAESRFHQAAEVALPSIMESLTTTRDALTRSIILFEYGRLLVAHSKKQEAREILREARQTQVLRVRPLEEAIKGLLASLA